MVISRKFEISLSRSCSVQDAFAEIGILQYLRRPEMREVHVKAKETNRNSQLRSRER